jgi:hypothetical protein
VVPSASTESLSNSLPVVPHPMEAVVPITTATPMFASSLIPFLLDKVEEFA